MFYKFFVGLLLLFTYIDSTHAIFRSAGLENLKNDKEVVSTSIKKKEFKKIKAKYSDHKFNARLAGLFYETIQEFLDDNYKFCELRLIQSFRSKLRDDFLKDDEESLQEYYKVLRVNNYIDDIFYDILTGVNMDYFRLRELDNATRTKGTFLSRKELLAANPLADLYSGFKEWPDEYDQCSYNNFIELKKSVKTKKGEPSEKAKELKILNRKAQEAKLISASTFNKLEYFRTESNINDRNVWMKEYFNIVFKAKNKMRPVSYVYKPVNMELEDDFATEKVKRFRKITRRKLLYRKYNETQIIQLAQVLQKASRRMGVDPDTESGRPVISQEFIVLNPGGERETYVERIELDPQSQYNLARRLMRKDMVQLQMMSSFNKLTITHEDIVMAALETGYISLEDIEVVVKYDDLWNPHKSTFEKVMGFVFRVAGYSTFFLPPPWNIAASIAMGIAEGIVDNKYFSNGASHDNPATFIE